MRLKDVAGYVKAAEQISIIMGAGASLTAGIPTAPSLVKRINTDFSHCLGDLSDKERLDYGRVMGALAPGDRKSLIQPLLDQSLVNWGHIALACIVRQARVKRILTFNFDLILERAASLVGIHLPVYDFGVAPTRDIGGLAAPAIFHLHGQSYGLRLMNSEAETAAHKDMLRPLLADSLRNHLTIVVGYSGEADAAFKVMEEEFDSHQNLIWLGYEAEAKPHLSGLLSRDYTFYIGECDFDQTMIELAEALGCWPPEVIKNPSRHILNELGEVAAYPVDLKTGLDLLTSTRRRLKEAANVWEAGKDGEARVQDALISGSKPEPTEEIGVLSETELTARAWAHIKEGHVHLREDSKGEARLETLRLAGDSYSQAVTLKPDLQQGWAAWGSVLSAQADLLPDVITRNKVRAVAEQKYATAYGLNPKDLITLRHWASTIAAEGRELEGVEALNKFKLARQKFNEALSVDPNDFMSHNSLGALLLSEMKVATGTKREELISEAVAVLDRAKEISGKASYNKACLHSLCGEIDEALSELKACLADGVLPSRTHLENDADMDSLRSSPAFISVLSQAKSD